MALSNGDTNNATGHLLRGEKTFLDHAKALEILEEEYPKMDGLDVQALLDSDKHGALTYNDFLILPGYIGMPFA